MQEHAAFPDIDYGNIDHGEGFYKLFTIRGKQKEIVVQTFDDYNTAFYAFNMATVSRVLTAGFEVKSSRNTTKRNKHDLTRLKNYINDMK